ncbi:MULTISPECIES: DUF5119 domain-containing protein [Bacteroides]|jgi:hypothetical protein|uniref:Uncharacterized protein n=1 Tax=Bacteroides fragilis TaxID=817 RepID=A0A0I9UKT0_BACFG|nr:DUF5119 domain-containing protein [Bacteroides fragilis]MCE8565715.1 DUF5119 domain-containing protein [Bacteroides fragilis]MCM0194274.1 DUF5119 domain-containing protein [Bacteroides fragilis]MCM0198970.1 DUF5119 domain-containing protein [Bacteroides fragilis]MCM0208918.1 DUF5119 domain-containing protein [Bacteroides fragilis]MCM0213735.1 DUF5119 domain-containing protein [Bacteroides fragilis]
MKDIGQLLFVLFCPLLLMTGCSRRELLDDYPVSGVRIALNWEGVTEKLPEGMQVIFYPKDGRGKKKSAYLSATGGEVPVPPGHYSVVVYNYDTETVLIRGEESYETIQAYTNLCKFGVAGTEKMVWGPDPLYVINIDDLDVRNSEETLTLELKPRLVVRTYSFSIKAQGLSNVSTVIGSVGGMADHYFLGKGYAMCDACPINIDLNVKGGKIEGVFTTFGLPEVVLSRAETELPVMMNLMIIKVDKSVQEVKINITEAVQEPTGGGEGGEGDETKPPTLVEVEIEDEIKVDDVEVPPGGGGGIGGDVGDWDDETNVELPVG